MARAISAPTLTPQMFRHFAVITVVITGLIAMFADGEGREMLEDQARKSQQRAQMQSAAASGAGKTSGKTLAVASNAQDQGSWDPDPGLPSAPRRQARRRPRQAPTTPYGLQARQPPIVSIPRDRAESMTPDEIEREQHKQMPMTDASSVSQQQRDQIHDASRRRSGSASSKGD